MKFNINDIATIRHTFTEHEVLYYSGLIHDDNPIHTDKKYAEKSIFGRPVVPGMFAASFFSGLIGSKLPGKGSIYLGQNLNFLKPVFIGEQVLFVVKIIHIRKDKPIITLNTYCINDNKSNTGTILIKGEAIVKAPKEE